jgi:hypothetical protein
MAWAGSSIFRQWVADQYAGTQVYDVDTPGDVYMVPLYGTTPTPDNDVTAANTAYAVGQWVVGNEISHADWAAGGRALAGMLVTVPAADVTMLDATDLASGPAATLAGVFGNLIYNTTDTTPTADPGMSYHYFGGSNGVTNGTLTIVWHANGVWRITTAQA